MFMYCVLLVCDICLQSGHVYIFILLKVEIRDVITAYRFLIQAAKCNPVDPCNIFINVHSFPKKNIFPVKSTVGKSVLD